MRLLLNFYGIFQFVHRSASELFLIPAGARTVVYQLQYNLARKECSIIHWKVHIQFSINKQLKIMLFNDIVSPIIYCYFGVRLRLCGTAIANRPLSIPQTIMNEYGAAAQWYWHGKTEGLGEKPVPVPLCPTQIPHGLPWERIWASISLTLGFIVGGIREDRTTEEQAALGLLNTLPRNCTLRKNNLNYNGIICYVRGVTIKFPECRHFCRIE
jgi:hypothetical protein